VSIFFSIKLGAGYKKIMVLVDRWGMDTLYHIPMVGVKNG